MSKKSEPTTWNGQTCCAADSHAKTLAPQESEKASQAADQDCGQSTPGSFASFDPDTSSWKTLQRCVFGGWEPFSETWPRAGMMRCGTAYRLPPSAPITAVTGCSWLPTPTASGFTQNKSPGKNAKVRLSLHGMAKKGLWPTPTARDHKDSGNQDKLAKYAHKKRLGSSVAASNPHGRGSLNPPWVEWLMGFPIGWTDSER